MEIPETKPAHRDGGGPRDFEQLGGQLEITNRANSSISQALNAQAGVETTSSALRQGSATPAPTSPPPSHVTRLNAKPIAKAKIGVCRECGAKFQSRRATKEFCSKECRQAFNNMQMTRGVLAYQLLMAHRYERAAFEAA